MKKDYIASMLCINKNGYWNGHYIVALSENKGAGIGILNCRKKLTTSDYETLTRVKEVLYVI